MHTCTRTQKSLDTEATPRPLFCPLSSLKHTACNQEQCGSFRAQGRVIKSRRQQPPHFTGKWCSMLTLGGILTLLTLQPCVLPLSSRNNAPARNTAGSSKQPHATRDDESRRNHLDKNIVTFRRRFNSHQVPDTEDGVSMRNFISRRLSPTPTVLPPHWYAGHQQGTFRKRGATRKN